MICPLICHSEDEEMITLVNTIPAHHTSSMRRVPWRGRRALPLNVISWGLVGLALLCQLHNLQQHATVAPHLIHLAAQCEGAPAPC